MSSDDGVTESEMDFELPFGWSVRVFEVGFFAVVLAASLTVLVLSGVDLVTGSAAEVLRALFVTAAGLLGTVASVAGGLNALQLLRDRRPALKVSKEGILNRTYWSSTALVPWDEVVDIRRTRASWISEIVLTDPEAFRSRQIFPIRLMMRITTLLGIGSLPVYLPQIAAPRGEVDRLLGDALDARQLAAIREHRRLEGAAGQDLPTPSSGPSLPDP